MSKPVEIEFLMKDGISAGMDKIRSYTESLKNKASLTSDEFVEMQGNIVQLNNFMAILEAQLKDFQLAAETAMPDMDQTQNIERLKSLESQINDIESELKQLQEVSETVQVVPSQMQNAEKRFNGLHNSIQQMAREMPSLAIGPQTFFMAISNNLPIFADEVKRAKEEYADLVKNGKEGEPVWKQILSSLFSWQTAMTTGIMLLTMYGDKIIQWAKNLRSANNDSELLRKAIGESEKAIIAERVQIDNLFNSLKSAKEGTQEYVDAKKAIIDQYGSYLAGLSTEVQSLQDVETAYKAITRAAEESARARAKEAYIKEEADNYAEKMGDVRVDVKKLLEEKFGKEKGGEYYWKIVPILDGEKMTDEVRNIVSQFDETKLRMVGSGMNASYVEMTTNDLKSQLTNAAILRNQLDQAVSNANDRFANPGGNPEKEIIKNKEHWENYINEQQRLLDAMTEEQLLTEDAQKIRSNILEAQKKLEAYNVQNPKDSGNDPAAEEKKRIENEKEMAKELRRLRWENEQAEINQMKEGSEKRIRQIKLDYEKAVAEISDQTEKWKEAQNGVLTKEQEDSLKQANTLAYTEMVSGVRAVEDDEVQKGKEKLNKLLEEYKNYDQRRRDIETAYAQDMSIYNAELANLTTSGGDTSQIQASIEARTEAYRQDIQSLEADILHSTEFYDRLFSNVSENGYKVLRDFYAQAKDTLDNAKVGDDGVTVDIPVKDADGKFVKKAVKITVAEYEKMKQQVVSIQRELEKKNPFAAFKTSWTDLMSAIKNNGDVSGALSDFNSKGKELTSTIGSWGDSLGAVFGDRFSNSINEMMTMVDGVMGMGTGIGQIFAGDIVGGITNTLSGLSSIVSMISSWKEKNEEMAREQYIAEIETNRAIRERNAEYAANRDTIQDIIANQEVLNWLVEKGYSKPSSVSVWEAQMAALQEYQKNLEEEISATDELWEKVLSSEAHWEWGNSMNGGSTTIGLKNLSAEQIELYYNQGKLTEEAAAYYEQWVESGKSVEELKQNIEETYASLQEMVMGTSFDGFLSNVKNALREAQGDISKFADFSEETISEALLNAFMYQHLATALEPLYNDLSEHLINGTADKEYFATWMELFQNMMGEQWSELETMAEEMGIDIFSGMSQSGKSGSFAAMSQEQGTKLEGLFVSAQMHLASIDERQEDVAETMSVAVGHLRKIEENTGNCKDSLEEINQNIKTIIRDGVKAI